MRWENSVKGRGVWIESAVWFLAIGHFVYRARSMLVFGHTTMVHDNIYWCYPFFHFFAESLQNGVLPLWNPYSHAGEPFYPVIGQTRLYEPVTLLTILIGRYFTTDILMLFNWNRFLLTLQMAFGLYWVIRPFTRSVWTRASLPPILLFSSISLGSFHQDAILSQFLWVPYLLHFLLKIVFSKDYRWRNFLFAAACTGISWQSYFFTGTWIFLLLFFATVFLFHRALLADLCRSRKFMAKALSSFFLVVMMMAISAVSLFEQNNFVFPARMLPPPGALADYKNGGVLQMEVGPPYTEGGVLMPYQAIEATGTFGTQWNFLQLLSPTGSPHSHGNGWGKPSEAYMYLGILPWLLILIGIFNAKHEFKYVFGVLGIAFSLLYIGPPGILHRLLYYFYPPLWFVRHLHGLVGFIAMCFLYFYVLGCEFVLQWLVTPRGPNQTKQKVDETKLVFSFFLCLVLIRLWLSNNTANVVFFGGILLLILLTRNISRMLLILCLFLAHAYLVIAFCSHPVEILHLYTWTAGLPVIICFYFKKRNWLYPNFIAAMGFIIILLDLDNSFVTTRTYKSQPHLGSFLGISTRTQQPKFNETVGLIPLTPLPSTRLMDQDIRNLPVLHRRPYIFSPLYIPESYYSPYADPSRVNTTSAHNIESYEEALRIPRWSSFLLLKNYHRLIFSNVSPAAQAAMFSYGDKIVQWKKGVILSDDKNIDGSLEKLMPSQVNLLLKNYALVADIPSEMAGSHLVHKFEKLPPAESVITHKPFSYQIQNYSVNKLELKSQSSQRGFLYIAAGHDPGWRAFVNGVSVHVLRANMNFQAIELPSGTNHVSFVYHPSLYLYALFLFYGGFGFCLVFGFGAYLIERASAIPTTGFRSLNGCPGSSQQTAHPVET